MLTQERTYLPTDITTDLVTALDSDATGHSDERLYIDLPGGDSRVELPSPLASLLRQAVQVMSEGLAVTVRPQTRQLTTSQVADLLGVTRPTVVKLLESGAIPYMRVGTHRRVDLPDALRYRDSRCDAQYQFIANTAIDNELPLHESAEQMKVIRAKVARQRKATRA